MTMPVPAASASGTLRCGSRTSAATKVTFSQATEANSEPTWATQNATSSP